MQKGNNGYTTKGIRGIVVLFCVILLLSGTVINSGGAETQNLNCKTTATSIGLDIVIPIKAGEEEFHTGNWVYGMGDHDLIHPKDYCALDFVDVEGKQVVAVADGKVQVVKEDGSANAYGHYVVVVHDNVGFEKDGKKYHYYSLYAHLQDPTSEGFPEECKVVFGKPVKAGDCIGVSGSTGKGGAHLHFTMYSGTAPIVNVSPLAPENSRGIILYRTLGRDEPVTPLATASTEEVNSRVLSLKINEELTKTFTFTNTSKIEWNNTNRFELVRISGSAVGAPERVSLSGTIKPGEDVAFPISITGITPGFYISQWQLHHNDVAFGPVVTLRYLVGVDSNENIYSDLWKILEPILKQKLTDLVADLFRRLWNEILKNISSLCSLAPLGALGILFAAFQAGQRQKKRPSWKPNWKGQGSWLSLIFSAIGIGIIFWFSTLLLSIAGEFVWWTGPIKNIGLIILTLGGLLLIWGLIGLGKWVRNIGFKRIVILLVLVIVPLTYFHGQTYRSDEPVLPRYAFSVGDLLLLGKYHMQDYWGITKEFTSEMIDAFQE